jgi:hypothetical protein
MFVKVNDVCSPALRPSKGETAARTYKTLSHRVSAQHRPNTGTMLRRPRAGQCTEGTQSDGTEHWRASRTRERKKEGLRKHASRAEASEKPPYPWNPPLRRPLQPKRDDLGKCEAASTASIY